VVQVLDYATSTVKGTYTVAPNTDRGGDFLLTFAENAAIFGTAQRQFRVRVFSRDLIGDLSNYVEVVPNNSVPATQSFTVFSGVSSVYLRVTTTPDVDVTGYRVWRDSTSGFTPSDANLVYDGADTYIALSVPTTSTYYYKVAAYDSFGKTGLNISGEQSSTPLTIAPDTFTKTGIVLSIGATNRLDWTSGSIIRNGSTSYSISAGNVTWSTGTVYLYFNPSVSIAVLQTSTNLADAVASGCYPIATYTGGAATNIKGGDGSAFISGSQIIAGTVGASTLVAGSAVITGTAQIQNGILVNAHIVDGAIETAKIKDAAITNAKIDRATVNKLVVTNADIDRASVNKLQVVTADIVDLSVDTFKIAGNAVVIPVGVQVPLTTQGSGASPLSASINMSGSSVNSKIIVTVCISSLEANAGTGGQSDLTIRDELGTVYPWVYGHYWYYANEFYSENYHYGLNVYQFVVTSNALKTFTVYVDNNADSTTFSGSLTLLGAKSSV
jgi:hypothetical protein